MKASEFCYWLQGYFEIGSASDTPSRWLSCDQVDLIKRHLALVFAHDLDPKAGGPEVQAKLNAIHDGQNVTMRC